MKLEVVVLGVSDVDRAKVFYENLGQRLDGDFTAGDDFHIVQMTVLSGAIRSQVDDEPVRVYRLYIEILEIFQSLPCGIDGRLLLLLALHQLSTFFLYTSDTRRKK